MVDQTPVLDIKPYIPQYDSPVYLNSPYLEENSASPGVPLCDLSLSSLRISESDGNEAQEENVRVMDGEERNGSSGAVPENLRFNR